MAAATPEPQVRSSEFGPGQCIFKSFMRDPDSHPWIAPLFKSFCRESPSTPTAPTTSFLSTSQVPGLPPDLQSHMADILLQCQTNAQLIFPKIAWAGNQVGRYLGSTYLPSLCLSHISCPIQHKYLQFGAQSPPSNPWPNLQCPGLKSNTSYKKPGSPTPTALHQNLSSVFSLSRSPFAFLILGITDSNLALCFILLKGTKNN